MNPEHPAPTRPRAVTSSVSEDGDTIVVSMREGSLGAAGFVSLWLAFWTVGCVWLAHAYLAKREPFMLLFGTPFWASWLFVAAWLLNLLFGRVTLALDATGLAYERRLPGITTSRVVPLPELLGIESRVFNVDSDGDETAGIEIRTLGRSIALGTGLPAAERAWLADRLDGHRRRLQAAAGRDQPPVVDPGDCRGCPPPMDCSWSEEDDFDGPQFLQRGRLDMATVLGRLFVTLFWNGIVGVFVACLAGLDPTQAVPRGAAWWCLFVFLIPFEMVGLALVAGLLAAVLDPVRVTRWRFGRDSIARVTTWAGLPPGWNRRFPHAGLGTATVLGDLPPQGPFAIGTAGNGMPDGTHHGLLIADEAKLEVCTIAGLTLGEARWMKGRLQAAGLLHGPAERSRQDTGASSTHDLQPP